MRRRVYIWEVPVRLTHWVNVASIVILSFTGYYIANPYIAVSPREAYSANFMGLMRMIHFITAFAFVGSVALRTYWAFVGNEWSSWRGLFPFLTKEGRKAMGDAIRYYFFLRREPPEVAGHNALAGMTYMLIVFLYILETITGLTLYGVIHSASIWRNLSDVMLLFFSVQTLRLLHHMIMWLLIAFAIHHVYSAWLVDMEEGNGVMSSIFSGFKFIRSGQKPDWIERKAAAAPPPAAAAAPPSSPPTLGEDTFPQEWGLGGRTAPQAGGS